MAPRGARCFPRAKLICNAENRGFCAANNQGIAAARGEFIALLNNDAEAEPGWLAALHGVCAARADVGMAASKINWTLLGTTVISADNARIPTMLLMICVVARLAIRFPKAAGPRCQTW